MAAVTARPTALPIWPTSAKTPPARDWRSAGKASEMMRFETVKRAVVIVSCVSRAVASQEPKGGGVPSALIGDRARAQKGAYQ